MRGSIHNLNSLPISLGLGKDSISLRSGALAMLGLPPDDYETEF